jgi:uncharacterized membrane protein SpoIIM required for sporulation
MIMPVEVTAQNFKAQIQQYCAINYASNFAECIQSHGITDIIVGNAVSVSGNMSSSMQHFFNILINNIYVLIFTLIFSLTFGAGAIFILAWNASVIAAAIGIFTESSLMNLHFGLMRYMVHGIPEIAAYFIAALAGGILSTAVIRNECRKDKLWCVLQDSVDMIIVAIIVIVIAAFIEVFITPALF